MQVFNRPIGKGSQSVMIEFVLAYVLGLFVAQSTSNADKDAGRCRVHMAELARLGNLISMSAKVQRWQTQMVKF